MDNYAQLLALVSLAAQACIGLCVSQTMAHVCAHKPPATRRRLTFQAFQLVFHTLFACWEHEYLYHQVRWWRDFDATFLVTQPATATAADADLVILHVSQFAFYATCAVLHHREPPAQRRQDYRMMYAHHLVTLALLGGSVGTGYTAFGCVVMYLHDVSDVIVDIVKCLHYATPDKETSVHAWATDVSFVALILVWATSRLYLFAAYVLHTSLLVAPSLIPFVGVRQVQYYGFNAFLLTLFAMHLIWFVDMLRIACKVLWYGSAHAKRTEQDVS